jgi:hypothetical protein
MMIYFSAGGVLGKRLLRKYVIGMAVPVSATTPRKKNNQRGPRVGKVVKMMMTNPVHPVRKRMRKAVRKSLNVLVGEV